MRRYKTWDIYYTIEGPLDNLKVVVGQVFPRTTSRNRAAELARIGNIFDTYEDAKAMVKKISQTLKEGKL